MPRWCRRPYLGLALLSLAGLGLMALRSGLTPIPQPDSSSYLDFDWSSLKAVLSQVRTPGYPAFLQLVQWLTGDLRWLPLGHWLAWTLAVYMVYVGLLRAGYRQEIAFAAAAPLMLGRMVLEFGPYVLTDSLAAALAIASAGCFLAVSRKRSGWLAWGGLAATTALAYQIRPAYLYLVPLWPILGLGLDCWLLRPDAPRGEHWRRAAALAAATTAPLLVYCGLRWFMVGDAGLVSFGGYNLVGVAVQYLDDDLARTLPEDLQPLARDILRRRAADPGFGPTTDFLAMEERFNAAVWAIAVPATQERLGADVIEVNRRLMRLSSQILVRRPERYLQWLAWNTPHALRQWCVLTALDKGTLLAIGLFLLLRLQDLLAGRRSRDGPNLAAPPAHSDRLESHLLLWTALGMAGAQTALLVLVQPANARYVTPAISLLPAVIALCLMQLTTKRVEERDKCRPLTADS